MLVLGVVFLVVGGVSFGWAWSYLCVFVGVFLFNSSLIMMLAKEMKENNIPRPGRPSLVGGVNVGVVLQVAGVELVVVNVI